MSLLSDPANDWDDSDHAWNHNLMMELHVCNRKGGVLRAFALGEVPEIVIGRDDECDIRIEADSVSREHCSIERDEDDYYIVDLQSTGGTFLDGSRIDRKRLEDGMVVTIGPAILKFYESGL